MASAVDPRLFDPRVRDDIPEITPQGARQTSVHGRIISTAGLSKPAPLTVIVVRVYSLPQGNQMSFLPGSSLSHPGLYLAWLHQPSRG